jgi:hypothetical protein
MKVGVVRTVGRPHYLLSYGQCRRLVTAPPTGSGLTHVRAIKVHGTGTVHVQYAALISPGRRIVDPFAIFERYVGSAVRKDHRRGRGVAKGQAC